MKTIAEKIKETRKKAELTQQQFSMIYNIPLATIESWERGLRTPPEYLVNFMIRCIEIDFINPKTTEEFIEEEPTPDKPKTLIFLDFMKRPFSPDVDEGIRKAYEANNIQCIPSTDYDGNTSNNSGNDLYMVLEPEKYGLDYGVSFYLKEV